MSLGNVKIQSNLDYDKTMATLASSVASLFTGGPCPPSSWDTAQTLVNENVKKKRRMPSVLLQIFFDKHITPGSHTRRRTLPELEQRILFIENWCIIYNRGSFESS